MNIGAHVKEQYRGRHDAQLSGGFTLVEMLVVVAIVLILTAFWFFRPDANRDLVVRNAALEMEVNMRQAQAAALGTQSESGTFEGVLGISYIAGVSGDQAGSYIVFADNPEGVDHQYVFSTEGSNPDMLLATHELPEYVAIHRIRKYGGGDGPSELLPEGADHGVTVLFQRPSTDALIVYEKKTAPDAGASAWGGVDVVLQNTRYPDIMQSVRILNTGLVEIREGDTADLSGDPAGPDPAPLESGPGNSGGAGNSGNAPFDPNAGGGAGAGGAGGSDICSEPLVPNSMGIQSSQLCFYPETNFGGNPTRSPFMPASTFSQTTSLYLYNSIRVRPGSNPILLCNAATDADETTCVTLAAGNDIADISAAFGSKFETGPSSLGAPASNCEYEGVYEVGGGNSNIVNKMSCSGSGSIGGGGGSIPPIESSFGSGGGGGGFPSFPSFGF